MWPLEHAAVGYLIYSLGLRLSGREPPTGTETIVLLVGTQVPDLVDKPLSWGLGVFPSGYAVGHSALVAVPLGIAGVLYGRRSGHTRTAVATVLGYWSHLLADMLSPLRTGDPALPARLLWPVVDTVPYETDYGLARGLVYVREFLEALQAVDPLDFLLLYVLLPAVTVGIWVLDGAPGTDVIGHVLGGITEWISR